MRKPRFTLPGLSWFLAKYGARDAKALKALRLSLSKSKAGVRTSALIEHDEDLGWTCR